MMVYISCLHIGCPQLGLLVFYFYSILKGLTGRQRGGRTVTSSLDLDFLLLNVIYLQLN